MSQYDDIQRWATTGGGEGDPADSEENIRNYVQAQIAQLGTLTQDTFDIPSTASGRARGVFTDYNDLYNYLNSGGLIINNAGGEPIPNPIVWIYWDHDDVTDQDYYEVWIDDETE